VKTRLYIFSTILLTLCLFFACSQDPFKISIANVKIKLDFLNLDSILRNSSDKELLDLKSKFKRNNSSILDYTFGYCIGGSLQSDSSYINGIRRFYSNNYIKRLEGTIQKKQGDFSSEKKELLIAFRRLKGFFPRKKIPKTIYFINSSFSASVFSTEKEIAIGVERYLGSNEKVIKELPTNQFFTWIKNGMKKEYLSRDVMAGWLMTHYCTETSENYASEMMRWGKILYITQGTLPNEKTNTILRYTNKQFNWALKNEGVFWKYLVENEFLFKTDEKTRSNLLNEGPFTGGLPEESPDRLGQFLGWRIVKQYMENHSISLSQLNKITYNELLQNYKAK
jgi:hypothetical protein